MFSGINFNLQLELGWNKLAKYHKIKTYCDSFYWFNSGKSYLFNITT
jgi:hypothetical protein